MSRINTNVSSMLAQRILGQQNNTLQTSLERLSTGLRINRGADDPAGLIASENLRAEKAALTAAIGNAERADQVVGIAEGGLIEISGLLTELEGLVGQSANDAGLTVQEKEANQLQIDSILQTIDRIANNTSFQGIKLLNGTYAYTLSGAPTTEFTDVKVNAAKLPSTGSVNVTVDTVTSAQTAASVLRLSTMGTPGTLSGSSLTIEVAGNKGIQQFTFASGTTATEMAAAVNSFSEVLGVSASVSTTNLVLDSTEFGSAQFVSVKKIAGDSGLNGNLFIENTGGTGGDDITDYGRDAVVTINGQAASVNGLSARVASSSLDVEVLLASAQNTTGATASFDITGGGATFSLSPRLDLAGKVSLGIEAVTSGRLGSNANGFLNNLVTGGSANVVDGDVDSAQRIVRDAIKDVSSLRGRIGAFQKNTVASMARSLGVALENTSAAESQIRDTDFAAETASLTRSQILVSAATNVLALANSQPQSVLQLLG